MTFRQFRRTFFTYFYRYVISIGIALLIFLLLWLLAFAFDMSEANSSVTRNVQIMQQFQSYPIPREDTAQIRAARKELADSMLLSKEKFPDAVDLPAPARQLRKVSRTGEPLVLNTNKVTMDLLWHQMARRIHQLMAITAFSLFVLFLSYAARSKQRSESLVDLPWRKPWAIGFFVLTCVPGLPFYVTSAVRFRKALRDHRFEWNEEGSGAREKIENDPEGALANYVDLRTSRFRNALYARKHKLQDVVQQRANLLQELSRQIQAEQRQQAADNAESRRISQIFDEAEEALVDKNQARAELEKIKTMQGVTAVMPWRGGIRVVVEVRYEYLGTLYDLGTWAINLNIHSDIDCVRLHSGVRPGWSTGVNGRHPDYYEPNGSGFCFRQQKADIQKYLDRGQFPEAVALMVYSFHHVNPDDRIHIPQAFKEVR